jgi:hypothetical protein
VIATALLPSCPVAAFLHLDCPGCGTTRALTALAHGDIWSALDHNVLTVAALPVIVVAFVWWIIPRWKPAWARRLAASTAVPRAVLAAVVVFTIVRNVPVLGDYLAST